MDSPLMDDDDHNGNLSPFSMEGVEHDFDAIVKEKADVETTKDKKKGGSKWVSDGAFGPFGGGGGGEEEEDEDIDDAEDAEEDNEDAEDDAEEGVEEEEDGDDDDDGDEEEMDVEEIVDEDDVSESGSSLVVDDDDVEDDENSVSVSNSMSEEDDEDDITGDDDDDDDDNNEDDEEDEGDSTSDDESNSDISDEEEDDDDDDEENEAEAETENTKASPDITPPKPSSITLIPSYTSLSNLPGHEILTDLEKEMAWLTEESKLAKQKKNIDWDYVRNHASTEFTRKFVEKMGIFAPDAKGCRTRKIVRMYVAVVRVAYEAMLKEVRKLLLGGHRRVETKEFLPLEFSSPSRKNKGTTTKKKDPAKVQERLNELAWLCEESILLARQQNKPGKKTADWDYIEKHASPTLRAIIDRKKTKSTSHRNFYHYLDLKNPNLRLSFQQTRAKAREKLHGGYRREGMEQYLPIKPIEDISSLSKKKKKEKGSVTKKTPSSLGGIQEKTRNRLNELAKLCEESIIIADLEESTTGGGGGGGGNRANWNYIEENASPTLRELINKKKGKSQSHRNFYAYMDLQNPKIKDAFEKKRLEVRQELKKKYNFGMDNLLTPERPLLLSSATLDHGGLVKHDLSMKRYASEMSGAGGDGIHEEDDEEEEYHRPTKRIKETKLERVYIRTSSKNLSSQDIEWQPARLLSIERTEQNQRRYTVKLDSSSKHGRITNEELILSGREYEQGMRVRKRAEDGTFLTPPFFSTSISSKPNEELCSIIESVEYNNSTSYNGDRENAERKLLRLTMELKRLREEYAAEEKRHLERQEAHDSRMRHYEERLFTLLSCHDDTL